MRTDSSSNWAMIRHLPTRHRHSPAKSAVSALPRARITYRDLAQVLHDPLLDRLIELSERFRSLRGELNCPSRTQPPTHRERPSLDDLPERPPHPPPSHRHVRARRDAVRRLDVGRSSGNGQYVPPTRPAVHSSQHPGEHSSQPSPTPPPASVTTCSHRCHQCHQRRICAFRPS